MPVFLRWLLNIGPANPIAVRLVQNGSRRVRHLYIRSAYLAMLILVLLWMLISGGGELDYRELALRGAASFKAVAYLQIALICILAPVFMAGAIAQEANPRTWEVQLTTPMSSLQIVLGHLLGRLFFIIALLVASMPLFALTQYFGGVPGRSIFASYAIASCAALIVGTIAIALSVSRLAGRRAVFAFYVSVISYLAVTAGIDAYMRTSLMGASGGGGVTVMTAINPFLALTALLDPTGYPRAAPGTHTGLLAWLLETPVTTWCIGSALLSLVLTVASTITVRTGGLQNVVSGEGGVPWYRRIFGLGRAGAEHRPPRAVWGNPIAWREAAARNATLGRMIARWAFVILGVAFGVLLVALFHAQTLSITQFRLALLTTLWGETAVIALVAINMAATAVSREREDGTLDILLTTPLTPGSYLLGKLRGLIAYLLPMIAVPISTLVFACVYVAFGGFGRSGGVMLTESVVGTGPIAGPAVLPEAALFAPLIIVPFVALCVMVGLQRSLGSKGTIGSVVGTVAVVGIVAGLTGLCGWSGAAEVSIVGPVVAALSPMSFLYVAQSPVRGMGTSVSSAGLDSARIALAVGAFISAIVYTGVVYAIHANMVRTFDMTVRKLAGMK
ncbi:MAG: ABC transporter permease subunit [Planctomycetota bacterium]|nr:ABC transporter permease subunit [Planctomycetota bacterium]